MLIAVSVAGMFVAARPRDPAPARPRIARAHERPWLTRAAMHELVADGGGLGQVFGDLTIGGPAPSPATRARIAEYARSHDLSIRLETDHDELAAVRLGVTFGGCCGYEGADAFASMLHRTQIYTCCDCGGTPANEWSATSDDGLMIRGTVHVNHLEVRWEAAATLDDVLDRAEAVLGEPRATVRARAGDRWHDIGLDRAELEVPYPFVPDGYPVALGVGLTITRGRIAEITMMLRGSESDEVVDMLRKRYGRPHVADDVSTWRTRERVIKFDPSLWPAITITATAPSIALARAVERPGPRS